ncbi:MAG: sugar ABC transporter substrate-binding protein [Candidatus Bathyarchaeota archaeon]|nr:sugar ABC transporter substrate-binding protein [Candidatus Bathyarchaeota archaeon]
MYAMKKSLYVLAFVLLLCLVLAMPSISAPKSVTVGSSIQPLLNPWVVANVNFQKHVAKALGIELVLVDTENKEEKQVRDVESLCARGVDGILITAQTGAVGPKIVNICETYNIPLANYDRTVTIDIKDSKVIVSQVLQDDVIAGYKSMKALLESGARNIVMIQGTKGTSAFEWRQEGMLKAMAEYPDAKILAERWIQHDRELTISTMESFLAKFGPGEVDGVWTTASMMGVGALEGVKKAGRLEGITVVTHDIMPDVVEAIQKGEIIYVIGGHWSTGGFALIQLYDHLNGFESEKEVIMFNQIEVNQENVEDWIENWIENPPLTEEQIRMLSKVYNPKANLKETVENLTINPVIK